MAVYTHISAAQAELFLSRYDLGRYVSHEGIAKGVSNSNFHLKTDKGRYILTLFERRRVDYEDLPFFFAFSKHLAGKGIQCPQAQPDKQGNTVGELADRAAVILDFLEGEDMDPDVMMPDHCAQAAKMLAEMHLGAADFGQERANSIGIADWPRLVEKAQAYADRFEPGLFEFLNTEMDYLHENWPRELPRGAVHADFFPDNVFFRDGRVSAVIDFYFSCTEFFAYDLAIALNAWCFAEDRYFAAGRLMAMMTAYQSVRPLNDEEAGALQVLCRGAAFRILLSRLEEFYEHDAASTLMTPHDPGAYLARLRFHQDNDVAAFI